MVNYLKSFIIGTSLPVSIHFYDAVANIKKEDRNYSYILYSFLAPLWFGLMNILSLYIADKWNLSSRGRFITISIISSLLIVLLAKLLNAYNYSNSEWLSYYTTILVKHFLTFNVIIYLLEYYIK